MIHRTSKFVSSLALLAVGAGCGGGGLRATSTISEGDWKPIAEGKQVVVFADAKECTTKFAKTRAELAGGGGTPLSRAAWSKSASAWTVKSSLVDDQGEEVPNVYVELQNAVSGETLWLYSKSSQELSCVHPDMPGVKEGSAAVGKSYSWAPWKASCTEIVAGGLRFKTLLESTPDGAPFTADSVALSSKGPLVSFAGGELLVTPSTLQACFAEPGSADARLPELGALAQLRVSPERCETDRQGGATHVACRSTVGAWNRDDAGIHGVRRTLGPIHFLDGRPVDGKRFARAVAAIDTGKASNARETSLYSTIRSAASDLISKGDDSVRIAALGDPAVTTNVKVVVRDVTIGELRTTRSQLASRYVVRAESRHNDAKDSARNELQSAENTISQKREQCAGMSSGGDYAASQACVDRCVANSGGLAAATCGFTCKDAGGNSGAKDECNAAVDRAEGLLRDARNQYDSMPDTITNTVYGDWPYERIEYSRKVTAVIQTDSKSGQGQKQATDPLEFEATDYEVAGDSSHNVEGHSARRDFIDTPDSILPNLAQRASGIAIKRLREALSQGAIDAALRALTASGGTAKPGYEAVDAMAFDVVGKRLIKAERYGEAAGAVPTADLALAVGECVLAVAVSADTASEVALHTVDGRFADQRERPFATLELCSGEWTGAKPPATVMTGSQVRWAVYRTRDKNH